MWSTSLAGERRGAFVSKEENTCFQPHRPCAELDPPASPACPCGPAQGQGLPSSCLRVRACEGPREAWLSWAGFKPGVGAGSEPACQGRKGR